MSNSLLNSGESQHLKLAINTFSCQDSPPPNTSQTAVKFLDIIQVIELSR